MEEGDGKQSSQTQSLVVKVFASVCKQTEWFAVCSRSFGLTPSIASAKGRNYGTAPLSQTSYDSIKKAITQRGEKTLLGPLCSVVVLAILDQPILRALVFSQNVEWWINVILAVVRICLYLNIAPPLISSGDTLDDFKEIVGMCFENYSEMVASYIGGSDILHSCNIFKDVNKCKELLVSASCESCETIPTEEYVVLGILSSGVLHWVEKSTMKRLVSFALGNRPPHLCSSKECIVATRTRALRECLCITRNAISSMSSRRIAFEESYFLENDESVKAYAVFAQKMISEFPVCLSNALQHSISPVLSNIIAYGVGVCINTVMNYHIHSALKEVEQLRHSVIAAMAFASAFFAFGIFEAAGGDMCKSSDILLRGVAFNMRICAKAIFLSIEPTCLIKNGDVKLRRKYEQFVADDDEIVSAYKISEVILSEQSTTPRTLPNIVFFGRSSVYEMLTFASDAIECVIKRLSLCSEYHGSKSRRALASFIVSALLKI